MNNKLAIQMAKRADGDTPIVQSMTRCRDKQSNRVSCASLRLHGVHVHIIYVVDRWTHKFESKLRYRSMPADIRISAMVGFRAG